MKKLILPLVVIVGIGCFFIYRNAYVEFQPISFDSEEYKEVKVNAEFYKNLQEVLRKYDESYKVDENGKVLIKRKLSNDMDLMLNYTKKALDTAFLFRNR
jgi:hypothetical protein